MARWSVTGLAGGTKVTVPQPGFAGFFRRSLSREQDIVAFMQSVARRQPGGRLALDVGAREGKSSEPYAQTGWLVASLDIAMEGLRRGVSEGRIQPGRAVVADGRHLPFRDPGFARTASSFPEMARHPVHPPEGDDISHTGPAQRCAGR